MPTKCIVINTNVSETLPPVKKPIVFKLYLNVNGGFESALLEPKKYSYIELIVKGYSPAVGDLIFAYDDPNNRSSGCFYTGQWNDGVVS